jgi:acetyl esterase/lipase
MPRPDGADGLRYRDRVFDTVTVTRDLKYGSAPDNEGKPVALRLDLYEPAGDRASRRPAVIWAHGGGFSGGDKAGGISASEAEHFAELGYVAVSINYRLLAPRGCNGTGATTPPQCVDAAVAAIHDAQAAVRWLRANAAAHRIDTSRIAIGGESAGGIIAAGVGAIADNPGESGNPGHPSNVAGWISVSGGLPGGAFIDKGDAPGLLFHGTRDDIVPHRWSVETADQLRRAGILAVFKSLEGAGHVPWAEHGGLFLEQSSYFLYHVMDLRKAEQGR